MEGNSMRRRKEVHDDCILISFFCPWINFNSCTDTPIHVELRTVLQLNWSLIKSQNSFVQFN